MSTRKISPSFRKELKDITRWSLPSGDEPGYFCSVYFDGTGDYLSLADNAALEMGSGDFTMECWFNFETTPLTEIDNLFLKGTGGSTLGYGIYLGTDGLIKARFSFDGAAATTLNGRKITASVWYHVALTRFGNLFSLWLDGELVDTATASGTLYDGATSLIIGANASGGNTLNGWISNLRIVKGTAVYTAPFQVPINPLESIANTSLLTCMDTTFKDRSPNNFTVTAAGNSVIQGKSPFSSKFLEMLDEGVQGGQLFTNTQVSTYSLVFTSSTAYGGGVLASNGDIHFVPGGANRGQKISPSGVVSTYSLVYTASTYFGGVLAPNGDIHFVPNGAVVGQKVSPSGVVSTYSLVYTATGAYVGGVLDPNGDVHFVPHLANRGQKVSSTGVVSTYSLIHTIGVTGAYRGGVLDSNGDIHFIPFAANVGQKVSPSGVVSTYSLVYTTSQAYVGGVLAPNGDIHFVPRRATVGQKISSTGVVSTYSLAYTVTDSYSGGVLAPNGDIHFVPYSAVVGQKISSTNVISTYSLVITGSTFYVSGVLTSSGDIHFVPYAATVGQEVSINTGVNFSRGVCMSPFFNKY